MAVLGRGRPRQVRRAGPSGTLPRVEIDRAIRAEVDKHNTDVAAQAIASALLGLLGTALVAGAAGWLALRGAGWNAPNTGSRVLWTVVVVCAAMFLFGLISSVLRGGTRGATERADEWFERVAEWPVPTLWTADASLAGLLLWAAHGPYAFFEAVLILRARLTTDPPAIRSAAELLTRLADGPPVPADILAKPALRILLTTGLAKPERGQAGPAKMTATEKGRDARRSGTHGTHPSR